MTETAQLTPTLRQRMTRSFFWIAVALVLLVGALVSILVSGARTDTARLSTGSAAPSGSKAVAQVLRQQGVTVTAADTLAQAAQASADPAATTVAVYDPDGYLTEAQLRSLPGIANHVVLLDPSFRQLRALARGVNAAGSPDGAPLVAACALKAATAAGTVTAGGLAYRVDADVNADKCLRSTHPGSADGFSFVQVTTGATVVSIVGATDAITNAAIAQRGNAAFALTLLGDHENLVWYLPSAADVAGAGDSAALTPGWLTPAIALTAIAGLAAALWRGRRFGALIIEELPVTVRSSETMEGRARLYQRGSARLRAIDALRIAAVSRIAVLCGLPLSASVDEVVLAAASVALLDARTVHGTLVDDLPRTDAEFVALGARLRAVEAAVGAAATR